MTPFTWLPSHVAAIAARTSANESSAVIAPAPPPILTGHDLWDHWPVLMPDGTVATIAGGALVIALTAPRQADPEARHAVARLRALHRSAGGWRDLGPLFPDGFSPGSREWAGSALLDAGKNRLTVYFTAAGMRGEPVLGFEQRMVETSAEIAAELSPAGAVVAFGDWAAPAEMVVPDGHWYEADMAGGGAIGTIKAFRDPYVFSDPASGCQFMLFAASCAHSPSPWNGAVGLAARSDDGWRLLPPVVTAIGLNNELERPHIIAHAGLNYLFWSTQRKVFAQGGPEGPTGLYGVVGRGVAGPWRPLNGTGLVFGNPAAAPAQAYSWQVLSDLSIWSFADLVGLSAPPADTAETRAAFAGTPAPVLRLALEEDRAWLR